FHEGLVAMMSAPQRQPLLIGYGHDIMRMDAVEEEANQTGSTDVRTEETHAGQRGEAFKGVSTQLLVVMGDAMTAQRIEIIHRRVEAYDAGNVRRARFELVRRFFEGGLVEIDVQDHFAAALVRGHLFQTLGTAVQNAQTGRTAHLVGREGEEI